MLMHVSYVSKLDLLRSSGLLKFDLDGILGKEDHLFKSLGKLRYLAMQDLPQDEINNSWDIFAVYCKDCK